MAADLGMLCTCNARASIIRWQLIWACSVHAMPGRVLKYGCRSGHALNMQCQDEYYKMAADLGMLCTCNARASIIRWQLIWACSVHAMPGRVLKYGCRSGHALNMQCQDKYYKMAADLGMLCTCNARASIKIRLPIWACSEHAMPGRVL